MINNTVLWSMNTVTWDSLDVLVQLIVFTLAGTSALVNIFTCTQAKRVFNPLHMRSSAQAENSFRQFHLAILELEMINT